MGVTVQERPYRPSPARWLWVIVLLIVLAAVAAWVYTLMRPRPAVAAVRDIVGAVTADGTVVAPPSERADVLPPYRAPVDRVETSVGAKVRRGDVLVRLQVASVDQAIAQARANLQAAETAYANAERQYTQAVDEASRAAANASTSSRVQVTTPSGETSVQAPGADVTPAQQALRNAQAARDSGLAPYRQQLDAAREMYQQARSGAKIALIRTPISGTVLALNAQPGSEVGTNQNTPVATIVNLDKLQVQAEMTPEQAGAVKPDMPVTLTFKELSGQQYHGTVESITSRVDTKVAGLVKQQRYVAIVSFDNDQELVKPGMHATAAIKTGEAKQVVAVPNDAVQYDRAGHPLVNVRQGRGWTPVAVAIGISDGRFTQIKQGVQAGQVVEEQPNLVSAASLPKP